MVATNCTDRSDVSGSSPNEGDLAAPRTGPKDHVVSVALALLAAAYLSLFWMMVDPLLPEVLEGPHRALRRSVQGTLVSGAKALLGPAVSPRWQWALVGGVMALGLPWLVMLCLRRGRPRDLGLRLPNRIGWRWLIAGYLASLPLLFVLALSPQTQAYYRGEIASMSFAAVLAPYLLVLIAEHFFFHGVLLAVLRPTRRWPTVAPPAPTDGPPLRRILRWLGLAQPTHNANGLARLTRWIGLPHACLGALLLQTFLFGLIHVGKSTAEFAMSLPGGLALGYVAYRCNSWLVPMVLHAATGMTVLGMIWLLIR